VLFDAYGDVSLTPAFAVRLGKFKPPVGLERLQSATDIAFAERGLPTNLVPNRDIGVQLGGDIHTGVLTYAVGVFNGVTDLGNGDGDLNDSKDLDARVFLQPITTGSLKGLGIGIAGTTGTEQGGLSGTTLSSGLPAYRSAGQQTVFRYRTGRPSFNAGWNCHALAALRNMESCTLRGAFKSFTDSTVPSDETTSSIRPRPLGSTSAGSRRGSCGLTPTGADTPLESGE